MQDLIKKHSEFISYPISLWVEKTTEKEVDDDEEEESSAPKEDDEEGKIEEVCSLSRVFTFASGAHAGHRAALLRQLLLSQQCCSSGQDRIVHWSIVFPGVM